MAMAKLFEEIANLDRLIHEPARLALLTALSSCEDADFTFLMRLTGLTPGNLSGHLNKLKEAGLVEVEKKFIANRPNTIARITPQGRLAIEDHWKQLTALHEDSIKWEPEEN
jgi:DNA-binding MarR family transcriptional regulator